MSGASRRGLHCRDGPRPTRPTDAPTTEKTFRSALGTLRTAGIAAAALLLLGPFWAWRGASDPYLTTAPADPEAVCEALADEPDAVEPAPSRAEIACARTTTTAWEGGLRPREFTVTVRSSAHDPGRPPADLSPADRAPSRPCIGHEVWPSATTVDIDYIMDECRMALADGVGVAFIAFGRQIEVVADVHVTGGTTGIHLTRGQVADMEIALRDAVTAIVDTLRERVEPAPSVYTDPVIRTAQAALCLIAVGLTWVSVRRLRRWRAVGTDRRPGRTLMIARAPTLPLIIALAVGIGGVADPGTIRTVDADPPETADATPPIRPDAADDPVFDEPPPDDDAMAEVCGDILIELSTIDSDMALDVDPVEASCAFDSPDDDHDVLLTWRPLDPYLMDSSSLYGPDCEEDSTPLDIDGEPACTTDDGDVVHISFHRRSARFDVSMSATGRDATGGGRTPAAIVHTVMTAVEAAP